MIEVRQYVPGQVITEPGIYSGVPMELYHSGKLCDGPSISSSGLRTIFSEYPMSYWVHSPLNPRRVEQPEKEAYLLGRATHHLALGEDRFKEIYVFQPEQNPDGKKWNNNGTYERAWQAERALERKTVLTGKHIEKINGMAGVLPWQEGLVDSGLKNCRLAQEQGILSGLIEHTIAFRDRETGIWLLSRPDSIPLHAKVSADLKTTTTVDYDSLRRTLEAYRYDMQAALGRRGFREVLGLDIEHNALVFVMTGIPHVVQVVEIKTSEMDEADKDNQAAIRTFARCRESGRWPGPGGMQSDGVFIERGKWAREQADARRMFLEEDHPV